jgi:probable HAF family extracellular repeat protein
MRRVLIVVSLLAGVVLVGVSGAGSGSLQQRWVIRDLGTLGGQSSAALAINERGQVAGTSRTATGERHVFLWQDGRMADIGRYGFDARGGAVLLNDRGQVAWNERGRGAVFWDGGLTRLGERFFVVAMNERGQVAGLDSETGHARLWGNGRFQDLGALPGHEWSDAAAINDTGAVVGVSYPDETGDGARAFLWRDGAMRDLGVLPGFVDCYAVAINQRGEVLGYCATYTPHRLQGFLWHDGELRDLDVLDRESILPEFLNDRGQVVGRTSVDGKERSFFWENGKLRAFGTPGRGVAADRNSDLNDRGQTVGRSTSASWLPLAFVWQDGVMTSLAKGRISSALDINEKGQIVGWRGIGKTQNGSRVHHAVLWRPVNG